MFEAIQNAAPKVQGGEGVPSNVVPLKPVSTTPVPVENRQQAEPQAPVETEEISQALLDELEQDIEAMHNIGLQFSVHEKSGKTMIRVMDKENSETIREIPPKTILDLAAKLDEMLGLLFDKKV